MKKLLASVVMAGALLLAAPRQAQAYDGWLCDGQDFQVLSEILTFYGIDALRSQMSETCIVTAWQMSATVTRYMFTHDPPSGNLWWTDEDFAYLAGQWLNGQITD